MSNKYAYIKEGDAVGTPPIRIPAEDKQMFLDKDGNKEVAFSDWWNDGLSPDTKEAWQKDCEEGTFRDDTGIACSITDGEPVDDTLTPDNIE